MNLLSLIVLLFCNIFIFSFEFEDNHWDDEWIHLVQNISLHQNIFDCNQAQRRLFVRLGGDHDLLACQASGLWGKVLRLSSALSYAFQNNILMIILDDPLSDTWVNVDQSRCDSGGWTCYFLPPSNCSKLSQLNISSITNIPPYSPSKHHQDGDFKWSVCPHQNIRIGASIPNDHQSNDWFGVIPRSYVHKTDVWYISAFIYYLLQFQPFLSEYLEMKKQSLFNSSSSQNMVHEMVGFHVRRNDKHLDTSYHHILYERYYRALVDLIEKTSSSNSILSSPIYLATDSKYIIYSSLQSQNYHIPLEYISLPSLSFLFFDDIPRNVWRVNKNYNITKEAIGSILDVYMLSQCSYLVLTHTSALSKVAFLYNYAKYGNIQISRVAWPHWPELNQGGWPSWIFNNLSPWKNRKMKYNYIS